MPETVVEQEIRIETRIVAFSYQPDRVLKVIDLVERAPDQSYTEGITVLAQQLYTAGYTQIITDQPNHYAEWPEEYQQAWKAFWAPKTDSEKR